VPVANNSKGLPITVSLGAATTVVAGDEPLDSLVKRADMALYQAKEAGRNRVMTAIAEDATPRVAREAVG
jgi:two-component system cell cycle response regulator